MARGVLELLWDSCYESGEDYVGTADDIEAMIGWTGSPGVLVAALVDAGAPEGQGFIEPVDEGVQPVRYRIHDLWDHVPAHVAKRRLRRADDVGRTADTVRQTAANGRRTANNGSRTASSRQKKDLSTLDLDLQIQPKSLEEKRSSQDRGTTDSAVLVFPVVGRAGPTWLLTRAQVAEWSELFPGLDVTAEARLALAWVKANIRRCKTASGMDRFLVGWLTRSVNRGAPLRQEQPRLRVATGNEWTCPHTPSCASMGINRPWCESGTRDARDRQKAAEREHGKAAS